MMLLALAAVAATTTFDLVCTGQTRHSDPSVADWTVTPWKRRIAIDLDRALACYADCEAPVSIIVKPDELVLVQRGDDHVEVNRTTGEYYGWHETRSMRWVDETKGFCTVGAFTPMPATKF